MSRATIGSLRDHQQDELNRLCVSDCRTVASSSVIAFYWKRYAATATLWVSGASLSGSNSQRFALVPNID